MANLQPLRREDLGEFEPLFQTVEQAMGFVPNSMLTMARRPDLLKAFGGLGMVILQGGELPAATRQLAAFATSLAAGCRYCQAHTSHTGERLGLAPEKLADILNYESSEHFDDAERAVLALAFAAGQVPNESTPEHFAALARHYSEEEILDIVGVIALFGFLNRWNDTLGTALEEGPTAFAANHLVSLGWTAGKHGADA